MEGPKHRRASPGLLATSACPGPSPGTQHRLPCGIGCQGELSVTHLRPGSSRGALRTRGTGVTFLASLSLLAFGTGLAVSTLFREGGGQ